ncbi:hypothetical protein B4U80_13150 [Leptotrombidium deliense]|uniref:N-acetyltransferase domain-containing protein n=1 Tax=Leptotrombidium deliense TaxID=299467 RepID=A0A443SBL7_9ACAR|nr:hypothetical protein B4U80_13150 [Leptotrombidium deliense]
MNHTMNESLVIRLMNKEDVDEVSQLLAKVFSEKEPCCSYLKVPCEDFYIIAKRITNRCAEEELSFVCLDTKLQEGEQIIGFRLSHTLRLNDIKEELEDEKVDFDSRSAFFSLTNALKREWFKIHSDEKEAKCFYFITLGIKNGYENKGIATKLVKISLKHAKSKGFDYVFVICTASATQHIFEKKYNFKAVIIKEYENIEYRGIKFLNGIGDPKNMICYELDLKKYSA